MDGTTGKEQRTLVKFDQSNHTHHHHAPRKVGKKKRVVDSSRSAEELVDPLMEGMGVVVYRIERKPIRSSEYLIRVPAPTFWIPFLFAKTCPATSPLSSCSRSILAKDYCMQN